MFEMSGPCIYTAAPNQQGRGALSVSGKMNFRITILAGLVAVASIFAPVGADAQEWSADQANRVEREELGNFDKKPLFRRQLWANIGGRSFHRTQIFWAEDPDAFRDLPPEQRGESLELLEKGLTILLEDDGPAGPFEDLGETTLNAKQNLVTTVDWPPVSEEIGPYPYRRTRRFVWNRKKKTFELAETEHFVPKINRLARLEDAIKKKRWNTAWRLALALDPWFATGTAPGCDRIVGHLTLDLLIAHLETLLAKGKADDAHRVLSLAFKFGGPRSAGCGITSSGVEAGQKAAFETGAKFALKELCGHHKQLEGKSKRCVRGTTFGGEWAQPTKTLAALMSFAEFAAARGDLELVRRIASGMVERRYYDTELPNEYKSGEGARESWAVAWAWFGDDATDAGFTNLAAAAYRVATAADDALADLGSSRFAQLSDLAVEFEPQTADAKKVSGEVARLLKNNDLLLAVGEAERFSSAELRAANVDVVALQKPIVEGFDSAVRKAKGETRADLLALRGKARWLNPISR